MTKSGQPRSAGRVSTVQRRLEELIANPLLRSLLRSRFHRLASGRLALLSYVGPKTGRRYTFPVAYVRSDDEAIVVTPKRDTDWWRNFQDSRRCTLWLRGTERAAVGTVVTGEDRNSLLVDYFDVHGVLGWMLGFGGDPTASPDRFAEAKRDLAVIRFALDGEE